MKNKIKIISINEFTDQFVSAAPIVVTSVGDEAPTRAGTFLTQKFSALYEIEVTKAGAYGGTGEVTITCNNKGATDYDPIGTVVAPTNTVAFNVGTVGITMTLTDGGDAVLTLGDKWTIQGIGDYFVIDTSMLYTKTDPAGQVIIQEMYPRRIQLKNTTGNILEFNIFSMAEMGDFAVDQTYFDFIPIANGSLFSMSDFVPMPTAAFIGVKTFGAAPGGVATLEKINFQPLH